MFRRLQPDRVFLAALVCSAALVGNYLGLRSVRDALFQNFDIKTALPNIKMVTALVSVGTALLMSRILSRRSPQWLMPRILAVSGIALLLVWALVFNDEKAAGVAIYFHMALFGGVMISGFWLMVNAQYDPRAAKRLIGLIGAGGTAGGVLACLLVALLKSPRIMLPAFAGMHLLVGLMLPILSAPRTATSKTPPPKETVGADRWGLRLLRDVPYLRTIALMVLFASMTSFYLDYVLQNTVKIAYGSHGMASRTAFFGWYYTIVPAVTFLMQSLVSRAMLEKTGLAFTAAIAPFSAVIGGAISLLAPGLRTVVLTRGAEMSMRNSFFKSSYEIFFTPLPASDRRTAKSTIDVGADSMGDILGGASAAALRFVVPAAMLNQVALSIVIALSLCGLFLLWRLKSAYVEQLELSVMNRSIELDLADVHDSSTRTLLYRTIAASNEPTTYTPAAPSRPKIPALSTAAAADPAIERIAALRSGDKQRIRQALRSGQPLDSVLVATVIPLLGNDGAVREALESLMAVADEHTGQLVDALLDAKSSPVVRRRLARLMMACGNQRAADGLLLGLRDEHFELRVQCGRALANLTAKNAEIRVDPEEVFAAVLREISAAQEPAPLEHIFTLLSLALPREPLQTAFEALRSGDAQLRGTMLEYLECTLPPRVREELWPLLEDLQRQG